MFGHKKPFILLLLLILCASLQANAKHLLVKGSVISEGKGIAGVVVSDGYRCVSTNSKGQFEIEANDDARYVFLSTPSGYEVECREGTIPMFYQPLNRALNVQRCVFRLRALPHASNHFRFLAQADVQVATPEDLSKGYTNDVADMVKLVAPWRKTMDVFSIDLGDIVGNVQTLYPDYIRTIAPLDMPVFRAIGNHDMEMPPSRTFEGSTKTFESYFGPVTYSFNRGKAHFIILDDCFCTGRDYQYIGYIDERTFRWLEQDLSYVPEGSLVFVAMHIPSNPTKKIAFNTADMEYISNAAALFEVLKPYQTHLLSGHTHWNQNIVFNDNLFEHNTAAVCGIWWKADVCMDGTPRGCGVYDVDGDRVTWYYHSFGHDADHQLRTYPVGASTEFPTDVVANVWNYDEAWRVEWLEDGKLMGQMTQFTGFDPMASKICANKEQVVYDWISPVKTDHLFRCTPTRKDARITVRVTDRFGRVYQEEVKP